MLLRLGDDFRAQNNSLKDVREMQAHDTAIALIREWASNKERELTERDVRELNEIILVKPFMRMLRLRIDKKPSAYNAWTV